MRPVQLKICGITSLEDSLAAVAAGAGWLGFNFYPPSPRYIQPAACAALLEALAERGATVQRVGVFVNAAPGHIRAVLDGCGLDLAQLSGDEPPEILDTLAELGVPAFKALRPKTPADLETARRAYPPHLAAPAWLVDAYRPGEFGGTGQTADWSLASSLAALAPIFLAGGLTPENVGAALRQVQPWGVDVASGVEEAPGRKSAVKMAAFAQAVRDYSLNSLSSPAGPFTPAGQP